MIKVQILKNNLIIESVEVKGHAKSADFGEDLVCAGVSAIIMGCCNALEKYAQNKCQIKLEEAYSEIKVLENSEKVQTILEVMEVQLETLMEIHHEYLYLNNENGGLRK